MQSIPFCTLVTLSILLPSKMLMAIVEGGDKDALNITCAVNESTKPKTASINSNKFFTEVNYWIIDMFSKEKSITALRRLPSVIASTFKSTKVNFIIAGSQKCGTSALEGYLRTHPQICMGSGRKEIHFFDNEKLFQMSFIKYQYYHSFFKVEPHHKQVGEATPEYMWWHDAPKRMWQYNPDLKIIIILRNPIDRAFSHWKMMKKRGKDSISFLEAIKTEKERCRAALPYQHRYYSYINRGLFAEQIRRIWHYFPPSQTLILRMEDLKQDPAMLLRKITDFLEVDSFISFEERRIVKQREKSIGMTPEEKDYLIEEFRHETRSLERMLGWDCESWLTSQHVSK